MKHWTQASFDAAAAYDEAIGESVVWLGTTGTKRGRAGGPTVGRIVAKAARMTSVIGMGCVAAGVSVGSALAPVSTAQAAIEHGPIVPMPTTAVAAAELANLTAVQPASSAEFQAELARRDVEEFLRFGSRSVSRHLVRTIVRAAAETEVDPIYLMALADTESSFRTDVKAATSSAQGLFQFIDTTWLKAMRSFGPQHGLEAQAAMIDMVDDRPVVADDASRAALLDLRRDPYIAAVMAAELLKRDAAMIGFRIGRKLSEPEMYLAHFLGLEDAARFIEMRGAKRAASATRAFPAAARANAAIFFAPGRRGRRGLSVPEVYARIGHMIDSRLAQYQDVAQSAATGV